MRIILILSLLLIVVNCSSGKQVYWCGDHPCANKKEREAYFKKTMTVEIKEMGKKKKSDKSKLAKILEQAEIDQNKNVKNDNDLAKQRRLEEKEKIKEQKAMMKQAKIEQKKRAKEEKRISKQIKKEEKKLQKLLNKKEKKITKKNILVKNKVSNAKVSLSDFDQFVNEISAKNKLKPYPDINDLPQ